MTEATPPRRTDAGDAPLLPRLAALVVAVLGFLPVANWIGGGSAADIMPNGTPPLHPSG
jgi:hypothetical protein